MQIIKKYIINKISIKFNDLTQMFNVILGLDYFVIIIC